MAEAKIGLVTGAGTGVGQAVSLALVEAGFHVVLCGRRREPLEATAAKAPKDRTLVVTADVGDPASVEQLFAQVRDRFGRLDLLFNNAGTGAPAIPQVGERRIESRTLHAVPPRPPPSGGRAPRARGEAATLRSE